MDELAEYFGDVAEKLKVLEGDMQRMITAKKKELEESQKGEHKELSASKKESPKDKFKKITLNSLQQGPILHKNKEDAEMAKLYPSEAFIESQLKIILDK